MASGKYDNGLAALLQSYLVDSGKTFKLMLLNTNYSPDYVNHDTVADINADELSGYTRQTISNIT